VDDAAKVAEVRRILDSTGSAEDKLAAIRQVLQLDALTEWRSPNQPSRQGKPPDATPVVRGTWHSYDDPGYP
jgi:hypothetical protein